MVQHHPVAEVNFRDVGRRHAHPATDRQEIQAAEQQDRERPDEAVAHARTAENPGHERIDSDHQRPVKQEDRRHGQHVGRRHTRHRLTRTGEVEQHRAVDPKTPVAVKPQIAGYDGRCQQGGGIEPDTQQNPPCTVAQGEPQRTERQHHRRGCDVTRDGRIECQPVPYDCQPLAGRKALAGIP